jgi:L-alanine-DL-glutamate epimerase-like enolase superfamily enzyme
MTERTRIKEIRFRALCKALRTTFATSLGRKQHLHSVIVKVTLDNAAIGVGEIPTSAAFKDETIAAIGRVLRQARLRLKGAEIGDYAERLHSLRSLFPAAVMTISGLETALFRASLASRGTPEHVYWGGREGRIETDITLPILQDRQALVSWIEDAVGKGFTAYKVKVSGNLEQDREMVAFIYRLLGEKRARFRLRLDGNQGYTVKNFLAFADFLEKMRFEIELFEQPLPKDAFEDLAYIKERCPIPLILDETIVTVEDARRVVDHNLGDGINIKIAKSGIGESIKLLELARCHGMKLMVGCMIETMVGLSAAVFFAAGTGAFDFIDLDAVHFLYGGNAYPGIVRVGPSFLVGGTERSQPVTPPNLA